MERHTRSRIIAEREEEVSIEETGSLIEKKALDEPRIDKKWTKRRPVPALLVVCALLLGLAALTYYLISSKPKHPDTEFGLKSIAVLPFRTMGEDPNEEYFGPGMADALVTKFSNMKQIVW